MVFPVPQNQHETTESFFFPKKTVFHSESPLNEEAAAPPISPCAPVNPRVHIHTHTHSEQLFTFYDLLQSNDAVVYRTSIHQENQR